MVSSVFESNTVNGVNLHLLKTNKYKTNLIVINFAFNLEENAVTKIALLPYILKKGTQKYQSLKLIQEKLDLLYGATLNATVFKRGERQIVQFSIEVANNKYISEAVSLLDEAIHLIFELIFNPLVINNSFKEEYLILEKEMLKNRINGIYDDKILYAEYMTIKHMCQNEPYKLNENGKIEDLDTISSANLYDFYNEWLVKAIIDIYFVGDIDQSIIENVIKSNIPLTQTKERKLMPNLVEVQVGEIKEVIEEASVSQGKLNIGLRANTSIEADNYIPLLLFNGILGGYAHSKLFVNVREKESMAYYASSRIDSHKGIITIQSGIEVQNYQRSLSVIKKQLESMKSGDITDKELSLTKLVLANQLKELVDKPRHFVDFSYHSALSGRNRTLDVILEQIDKCTINDIVDVAENVKIDTIYFLKGNQEEK